MGTVTPRKKKNGSLSYRAQIVIQKDGTKPIRESKTFDRKKNADIWIKKRETQIRETPNYQNMKHRGALLKDAIDQYIAKSQKDIGSTKAQVLETIKTLELGEMRCEQITSQDIIDFLEKLRETVQASTAANYLSHLSAVFTVADAAWGIPLKASEIDRARIVANNLGLISKSTERNRRPTLTELDLLLDHFEIKALTKSSNIPMVPIILFAIFSTRRQEEICNIKWSDLAPDCSSIIVRDMKHPGQKIGNDKRCELVPRAQRFVLEQPRKSNRIFPYNHRSVSAAFTRACPLVGIEDLRFHDLRHEGVSHFFELGRTIPQVTIISGHQSWQSLKRYTQLHQNGDKYAEWPRLLDTK